MSEKIKVFISYAREDESSARKLYKDLKNAGLYPWFDRKKLLPGQQWEIEIRKALRESHYCCILLSNNSVIKQGFLQKEIKLALGVQDEFPESKRFVIPIRLDECEPDYEQLRKIQSVDLFPCWNDGLEILLNMIFLGMNKDNRKHSFNRDECNHLIISPDTPFNKILWQELIKNKESLKIGKIDEFGQSNKFGQYKKYIYDFIRDSHAEWLFTVWPEDSMSVWEPKEYTDLLEKLVVNGKHVICFESGMTWKDYQKTKKENQPVFIIKTEYKSAVKQLIAHVTQNLLRHYENIHFIAILGPINSPPAKERRIIFNEFLAKLYHAQGLFLDPSSKPSCLKKSNSYWYELINKLVKLQNIRTTYLKIDSWYREEAEKIIASICPSLNVRDIFFHTCFFCGNDDIALGAREAVINYFESDYMSDNFSYIGFDGIEEMINELQAGMLGGTMKIQFKEMCETAKNIMKDPDSFMDTKTTSLLADEIFNP